MDSNYGAKSTEEDGTATETTKAGCNDPDQSNALGQVRGSHQAIPAEKRTLRPHRGDGGGFFGGEAVCELLAEQLLSEAKKGLQNAEACIDWYQQEKLAYQERVSNLESIVEAARDERLQQQAKEEEE